MMMDINQQISVISGRKERAAPTLEREHHLLQKIAVHTLRRPTEAYRDRKILLIHKSLSLPT
jgi:hypothetical protein